MTDKFVIRTSDRLTFKRCRTRWDFGSKIRQDYEPIKVPKPLDFGTAIHRALEVYYDPKTWEWHQDDRREMILHTAKQAFIDTNRQALLRYEHLKGPDELVRQDFQERHELGLGMLENYFGWAQVRDNFIPVKTEIEFEVPIPVPPHMVGQLPYGFSARRVSGMYYLTKLNEDGVWVDVVYQGRIDLIVQDHEGRYFLDDHKTAGQMREDVIAFLEMDEQMKSYGWAIQTMLGIPVAGIIYNELYKGVPTPPKENATLRQGRMFSVNKQQDTSYTLYLETVKEHDPVAYQEGLYDDILNYLQAEGKTWFRRTRVIYNEDEYRNIGYQICLEAIDMLSDPLIYPNPTRFQCGYCDFRAPCLATMESGDVEWILKEQYVKRSQLAFPSTTDTTGEVAE